MEMGNFTQVSSFSHMSVILPLLKMPLPLSKITACDNTAPV